MSFSQNHGRLIQNIFLVLSDDIFYVYNWINKKAEDYPLKRIEENPNKFYSYLFSQSYRTPNDAVPFINGHISRVA